MNDGTCYFENKTTLVNSSLAYICKFNMVICVFFNICTQVDFIFWKIINTSFNEILNAL